MLVTKRCPKCGYDLRGNMAGECPECGAGVKARTSALFPDIKTVVITEKVGDNRTFTLVVNDRTFLDYTLATTEDVSKLWSNMLSDFITMGIGKFGSAIPLEAGIQVYSKQAVEDHGDD